MKYAIQKNNPIKPVLEDDTKMKKAIGTDIKGDETTETKVIIEEEYDKGYSQGWCTIALCILTMVFCIISFGVLVSMAIYKPVHKVATSAEDDVMSVIKKD